MEQNDLTDLATAKKLLENPGYLARLANAIGRPIEGAVERLPDNVKGLVQRSSHKAISAAAEVSFATIDKNMPPRKSSNLLHKFTVGTSGAVGGAFGLAGLPVELPISTAFMFRSIAQIARSENADLGDPRTRADCLSVFALGGRSRDDDAAENGYFATRIVLAKGMAEAVEHLAAKGSASASSPALARLIAAVSARFGVQVSQKVAAQLLPVIGAAGGAVINTVFINHYQQVARGHFIVRRLESKYGEDLVLEQYNALGLPLSIEGKQEEGE